MPKLFEACSISAVVFKPEFVSSRNSDFTSCLMIYGFSFDWARRKLLSCWVLTRFLAMGI